MIGLQPVSDGHRRAVPGYRCGGATRLAWFGRWHLGSRAAMRVVDDLEHAEKLDGLVGLGQRWARLLRPGRCRDALYGVWLGHPLHPMLAQAPIGLWLSATVLDAWPGGERASRRLVLAGLAAAVPAALAGAVDWSEQHEQQMRVGTVHAMANGAAVGLYTASLAARSRPASRVLRLAGLATAGVAGLLGGHISFRLAGGANQAEPVPHLVQPGWHDLMPAGGTPGPDSREADARRGPGGGHAGRPGGARARRAVQSPVRATV